MTLRATRRRYCHLSARRSSFSTNRRPNSPANSASTSNTRSLTCAAATTWSVTTSHLDCRNRFILLIVTLWNEMSRDIGIITTAFQVSRKDLFVPELLQQYLETGVFINKRPVLNSEFTAYYLIKFQFSLLLLLLTVLFLFITVLYYSDLNHFCGFYAMHIYYYCYKSLFLLQIDIIQ